MAGWSLIGAYEFGRPVINWLMTEGWAHIGPSVRELFLDPSGTIGRVGDLLVWNGANGQQVLAGLDSIGDTVSRIDQAVVGIESTQLAVQGTLGVVQGVSLATLGVTSLSATYMVFRLAALNRRLQDLSTKIGDIEGQIDAANKAHLRSSLQFLNDYERMKRDVDLEHAFGDARRAVNIYGQLTDDEVMGAKRLPVLNYRSRCYLLSLLAEIECQILREDDKSALQRIDQERERIRQLARSVFTETIAKNPESFLDPGLQTEGVSLELLTDLYRQAGIAGALSDVEIHDAAEMFEHLRRDIYKRKSGLWWVWKPTGKAKQLYLKKLRYVLACFEDANRINSLRMLISNAQEKSACLRSLVEQIKSWREKRRPSPDEVLVFSIS